MKKLLAILLALLTVATLAACDGAAGGNNELDDYIREDKVITFETLENGDTFHFENIDTETVAITAYEGSDKAHLLQIPEKLNGKTVVAIAKAAFKDCSKINAISFPATLTTIGDYAFSGCVLLEYVDIPETITSIGVGAFNDCIGMTSLLFEGTPQLAEIKELTFNNCTSLTSVIIPASVKTIEAGAFMDCTSLASLTVSEGVESIGNVAFRNCTALSSLTLPASLTNIGSYVFSNCDALYINDVVVPEGSYAHTYVVEQMKLPERLED